MGITYEELASDWEKSSFSASRQSMRSHWRNVYDWQWNMLIPQLCQGVWDWVMTHAAKENGWKAVPKAVWGPPAMPMIEPDKEGLAYSRLVRNGVMTYYEMLREQGKDPAAHIEEQKAVNKALDDADLVLDCDPRRVSSTGQGQKLDAGESDGSPLPAD